MVVNMRQNASGGLALLLPTVLSLVAFVLAMIALLAGTGSQQEALEPYHIVAINLSDFGHNLIPSPTSSSPQPSQTGNSIWDQIEGGLDNLGQDISDGINNITNGIADKVIEELGISEWYSLHVMTACEGMFSPNATNPHAWYNTTNCTAQEPGLRFNLSAVLDHEIKAGPLDLNLNQLPIPDAVQDAIDMVNDALLALFVFYVLASAFSGLAFLTGLAVLVMRRNSVSPWIIWLSVAISVIGALTLLIGSAIATYINTKGVNEINDAGEEAGISGIKGTKFITISWVAFALMFLTSLFWTLGLLRSTRDRVFRTTRPSYRGNGYRKRYSHEMSHS
ncbi:hypothetical protein F5Y19DRAFT_423491 [Xylariaceae sp. FL1651]|nr:hypothetical protein F5Y19DRAFT_423491 [Xylariaceae sp. FL1651]